MQPSKRASELKKPPTKKRKLNDSSCKKQNKTIPVLPSSIVPTLQPSKRISELNNPPTKKHKLDDGSCKIHNKRTHLVERSAPTTTWDVFRYHQTDLTWQHEKCDELGLTFHREIHTEKGGEDVHLHGPDLTTVVRIVGDGNCLFRCFSYIITGSQDQHFEIRTAIVSHMRHIAPYLENAQCVEMGSSIEEYTSNTSIDEVNSWATTNEMSVLAHLLKCNIYSYGTINQTWEPRFPNHIDPGIIEDVTQKSLYIVHVHGNHFEVVTSQLPQ